MHDKIYDHADPTLLFFFFTKLILIQYHLEILLGRLIKNIHVKGWKLQFYENAIKHFGKIKINPYFYYRHFILIIKYPANSSTSRFDQLKLEWIN